MSEGVTPSAKAFLAAARQWEKWFFIEQAACSIHYLAALAEERSLFESGVTAAECHRENEACAAFRTVWRHILSAGIEDDEGVFRRNRKRAQRRARDVHRRHARLKKMYAPTQEETP